MQRLWPIMFVGIVCSDRMGDSVSLVCLLKTASQDKNFISSPLFTFDIELIQYYPPSIVTFVVHILFLNWSYTFLITILLTFFGFGLVIRTSLHVSRLISFNTCYFSQAQHRVIRPTKLRTERIIT